MSIKITIIENGPALIVSNSEHIEIEGTDIKPNEELISRVAICRCGKSKNGIYCDGSHKKESTDKEVERKNEY